MAKQLKHLGRIGDRKVIVLWRQVPQESHMALVVHPEILPVVWAETIMKLLESDIGQAENCFADVLHRSMFPDGKLILETLHRETKIKKVRTEDVIMTPTPTSSVRLDELNTIIDQLEAGGAGAQKLAENDAARGLVDPATKRAAEAAYKSQQQSSLTAPQTGALSDGQIAENMLLQAKNMEREAKSMIAEAARMKKEAANLSPNVAIKTPDSVIENTVTAAVTASAEPAKRGRGRPPKVKVAVADASAG